MHATWEIRVGKLPTLLVGSASWYESLNWKSPEFILTPAAPLELALKGMKIAEADLTARLSRQRNEDAKSAGLMKKLGKAQLEVMSKSGVDVGALAREVRQLRRQRAPKQAFPELLQSKVPVGLVVPGYSVVTPPYSWGWSPPGNYVDYAPSSPATLSNYANPENGTLGWAGLLVQGFEANSLVETPFYQQYVLYDEGSNGGWDGSSEYKNNLVNITFTTPWFFVQPNMWYAIWFWCGGDIHAEGWVALPPEEGVWDTGSSASSLMDVSVPSFMPHFRSTKRPLAKISRKIIRPKSSPIPTGPRTRLAPAGAKRTRNR